jgi:nitrite reductase/ring-hydroxylating ferredoxin subunit
VRAITRVTGTLDVTPSHSIVEEVNGKTLAVFHVDGVCHAMDNTCMHWGRLTRREKSRRIGRNLPWHGWQFDVTTGACVANPSARVERYEVQLEGTAVKVPR